jgi:hypothetical protein
MADITPMTRAAMLCGCARLPPLGTDNVPVG